MADDEKDVTDETTAAGDAAAQAAPEEVVEEEPIELAVDEDDLDEHGFASVWRIAATTMGGESNMAGTREMAGRLLGFLCKKEYEYVVASSTDLEYLDGWFERDKAILYNWKGDDSGTTDAITQAAYVPAKAMISYLQRERFKPTANYSPRRADRIEWFQEKWGIG